MGTNPLAIDRIEYKSNTDHLLNVCFSFSLMQGRERHLQGISPACGTHSLRSFRAVLVGHLAANVHTPANEDSEMLKI